MARGRKVESRCAIVEIWATGPRGRAQWAQDAGGLWWHYPYGVDDRRRGRAEERECEECNNKFLYRCTSGQSGHGRYCSISCANRSYKPQRHRRGANHPNFKGGHVNKEGYRQIWSDGKLCLEHRLVMEKKLGRRLLPTETVHHKNGVRDQTISATWSYGQLLILKDKR